MRWWWIRGSLCMVVFGGQRLALHPGVERVVASGLPKLVLQTPRLAFQDSRLKEEEVF